MNILQKFLSFIHGLVVAGKHVRPRRLLSNTTATRTILGLNPLAKKPKFAKMQYNTTNNRIEAVKKWHPKDIIEPGFKNYVCMILNTTISIPPEVVEDLWQNATLRCLVDGGSNRWRHFLRQHNQMKMKPPDYITGDFDSVCPETMQYFNNNKTIKIHTPDQNATDFTKAVRVVQPITEKLEIYDIVVFHDTSGRLDQLMANLNTLYNLEKSSKFRIYLLSGNSMTWLLSANTIHSIEIPKSLVAQQRWCSLIPLGRRANCVSTQGLKWNLKSQSMEFGELVSTSNTYAKEEVLIVTDSNLIWSMGLFDSHED